ncbi:hypothetical protein IAT38_004032 [Cryptococcus sp. DSM 104549]
MRLSTLSTLILPLLLTSPAALGQDDQIECDDSDLATYLIALIDTLYANGLTTSEELIVHLAETDEGYNLLEQLYVSSDPFTFLAPTDSAFQAANIWPPFANMADHWGAGLLGLHSLQGEWDADKLPDSGVGVASSWLSMKDELNATAGAATYQAVVMSKGDGGSVIVDGWWGNGSTWGGWLDNGNDVLDNTRVLPVDTVLSFPPSLAEALTTSGLSNISAAIDVVGETAQLQQLTSGGFTIFAPIDAVWTDEAKGLMGDMSTAGPLVGNHYTTNQSLYSPEWTPSGSYSLQADSGATLTVKVDDDGGSQVVLGDVEARIIRSDITLANGVMHVIDAVLVSDAGNTSSDAAASSGGVVAVDSGSSAAAASAAGSATGRVSATGVASGADSAASGSTKQVVSEQQVGGASRIGGSAAMVVVGGLVGALGAW